VQSYTNVHLNKKLIKIKKAEGIYLYTDNKKILDTTSGSNHFATLGWGNKEVISSMQNQLKKFTHIDIKSWHDENLDKLSRLVVSKKKHKLDKVFFAGNSGAEACEAAMRMSYQYFFNLGFKKKKFFISRKQSYHGCTTFALSASDRPNYNYLKPILAKNVHKISQHHYDYEKRNNETEEEYALRSSKELEAKILSIGPEKICGFIAETIMGGLQGDVPPVKNYWKYIRAVCNKYKIHLIIDEVYCGMGTTGKIYCIDYDKITPDFIFVGKTLAAGYAPLSMVLTSSKIVNNFQKSNQRIPFSSTHQGYSLGVAAALSVQKTMHKQSTLNHINDMSKYIEHCLKSELENNSLFRNIRGRGLRMSLEYKCKNKNEFGLELSERMLKKHNILIDAKWHRICITPAVIINKNQTDFFLDKLIKEFKILSKEFQ
tara:strand:+ start:1514 stop:2803 length:1290 start_codon:yes stop_codon:yes gene_type:complete